MGSHLYHGRKSDRRRAATGAKPCKWVAVPVLLSFPRTKTRDRGGGKNAVVWGAATHDTVREFTEHYYCVKGINAPSDVLQLSLQIPTTHRYSTSVLCFNAISTPSMKPLFSTLNANNRHVYPGKLTAMRVPHTARQATYSINGRSSPVTSRSQSG